MVHSVVMSGLCCKIFLGVHSLGSLRERRGVGRFVLLLEPSLNVVVFEKLREKRWVLVFFVDDATMGAEVHG